MSAARKIITQNVILILALGVAFFLKSLQLTAIVVVFYILTNFLARISEPLKKYKTYLDFFFLTLITFQVIYTTGGLSSPVFFLCYFLLFGVALLFEPSAALSLATIASIFFLLGPRQDMLNDFLQIASVFLISPLALLFGSSYLKLSKEEEKLDIIKEDLKYVDKSSPQENAAVEDMAKTIEA
jgi:hypothetical protein